LEQAWELGLERVWGLGLEQAWGPGRRSPCSRSKVQMYCYMFRQCRPHTTKTYKHCFCLRPRRFDHQDMCTCHPSFQLLYCCLQD
jgi:hypothetical protein